MTTSAPFLAKASLVHRHFSPDLQNKKVPTLTILTSEILMFKTWLMISRQCKVLVMLGNREAELHLVLLTFVRRLHLSTTCLHLVLRIRCRENSKSSRLHMASRTKVSACLIRQIDATMEWTQNMFQWSLHKELMRRSLVQVAWARRASRSSFTRFKVIWNKLLKILTDNLKS